MRFESFMNDPDYKRYKEKGVPDEYNPARYKSTPLEQVPEEYFRYWDNQPYNEETMAALKEAKEHPNDGEVFNSVDEMMAAFM